MNNVKVQLDTNMLVEEISDHSDDDSIEDIMYRQITRHCGNTLDYDIYMSPNRDVTYQELLHLVIDKVVVRGESFRNLVLRLSSGFRYKHVSITKARIRDFCARNNIEIQQALEMILYAIDQGNMADIYEHYDENIALEVQEIAGEETNAESFYIDTSYFAITWIRSPSGSGIVEYKTLKYVKVINPIPIYGEGNCLFDCISWCLSIDICNIDSVREALKYKSSRKPIKLKHLRHIATMLGCTIVVYDDKMIGDKLVSMKVGSGDKVISLVLNNKHYSVFDGIKDQETETIGTYTEPTYIFYDLETYFDVYDHGLVPYAMSYYIYESKVIDTYGCIIKTSLSDDISDKIYNVFKDYVELKNTIIVGYNNGAFDDYVLIDILCKYGSRLDKTLIDNHNRILTFKYGYIISRDLYRILNTSLSNATKSFACSNIKGILNHRVIQSHVDNKTFDEYMTQPMIDIIRNYSIVDVTSLKELYFKAMETFYKIPNMVNPLSCVTISQLSYKSYKRYIKNKSKTLIPLLPVMDGTYDEIIRRALIGGRCDVFAKGEFHDIAMVDVCSMYPHVMMSYKYPYHNIQKRTHKSSTFTALRRVDKYIPGRYGVYKVSIIHQPYDNIVPHDNTGCGTYDWHSDKIVDRWISNVLLEMLNSYNCNYVIGDGYILDCESGNTLIDFLAPIMSLKREQDKHKANRDKLYNPALRECLKLIMNSLSGKMCQRPIDHVKVLTNTANGCNAMLDSHNENISAILIQDHLWLMESTIKQPRVTSPTIIGCLIYDYAKQYMYDNIITKVVNKYYMDTDSMILSHSDLHLIDPSLFGDEAGKLKHVLPLEYGPFHCVIGAKKCYCIYTIIDSKEVIYKNYFKLKGVNILEDRRIPHHKLGYIQELIRNDRRIELNAEYSNLVSIMDVNTMRQLAKDNTIYVLCHQITRVLSSTTKEENRCMSISSRYIIKQLPLSHKDMIK